MFSNPTIAQPSNHYAAPAARILVGHSCAMAERDLILAMQRNGFTVHDFLDQTAGLRADGFAISDGEGGLRLVNWPPCGG
ncbi:MAG: hypothetical protein AAFU80_04410 [Pseudomonadota bacterium]